MFKLISFAPSPYARKVRIALAEKRLPFELLKEVPWDSTTTVPSHNPLEQLPVLLLSDGTSIYGSGYIVEWLEIKYPNPPLLPTDVDERLAALKLQVLSDGVCDATVLTLFEKMREGGGSPEWLARQRRKIEGGAAEMARLIGRREWAVAGRFTLGDIAVGIAFDYLSPRLPDFDWRSRWPDLAAYVDRLGQRPSFGSTVPVAQAPKDKVV